jgi:hypothetical protein
MRRDLKNFDLTVDEIKLMRIFRNEIDKLEEKLEEIRDNTLIRH